MGRRGYPPEFRRKVVDLVESGRSVAEVAGDLGISEQSIYVWRRQHRIDKGLIPGLSSAEKAPRRPSSGRRTNASPSWDTELAVARRAVELRKDAGERNDPKGGSRRSR